MSCSPVSQDCQLCSSLSCSHAQALHGINTKARQAAEAGAAVGGSSMPITPMTATSDVFDSLSTPAAAAAAGGSATFGRPEGIPLINTAALAAAGTQQREWQAPGSAAPSVRGRLSRRESDAFDFLQTPARGSHAIEAAADALALAAAGGIAAAAVVATGSTAADEEDREALSLGGTPSAAAAGGGVARRPGFRLDVNGLAEGSVSGALLAQARS